MSCTCGSSTCSVCTTTLQEFAERTTLADSVYFITSDNKKVSLATLREGLVPTVPSTDLSLLPDGTIPQVVGGVLVASALIEDADSIDSSKDITIPGDSLLFGDSVELHNICQQLGISSGGLDYIIPQFKVDDTQSYKPTWPNLGAESVTNIQTTDTTNIEDTTVSFLLDLSGFGVGQAVKINNMRLRGNEAVSGVRLIVSKDGAPLIDNSNVIFDYPQNDAWEAGAGYVFAAGDFAIDTKPLILDTDNVYYVTFKVPVGSGTLIKLKGDGSNVPYLRVDAQSGLIEDFTTNGIETASTPVVVGNIPTYSNVNGTEVQDSGFDIDHVKGLYTIHITQDSDLDPYVAGGKINLNTGDDFVIHGFINHSLPIVFGDGGKISGENRFNDFLNFTGTGNQIEYSGTGSATFEELGFICTGQNFLSATGTGAETLIFTNSYIVTCGSVGQFDNVRTIVFRSFSVVAATDGVNGGLIVSSSTPGLCQAFNMDNSLWSAIANGVAIDFQATQMLRIQIPNGNRFNVPAGATGVQVLAANGNFAATGVGVITGNIFEGLGTRLAGHAAGDVQWRVDPSNIGITGSRKQAQGSITGNVLQNTFGGGVGVPEKINLGALFVPDAGIQEQFTMDNTGRCTYVGIDPVSVYVDCTIFADVGGGAARQYNFYIYESSTGAVRASSVSKREYGGTGPGANSCKSMITMSNGDWIELWVEALTATTPLTPDTVSISVKADL